MAIRKLSSLLVSQIAAGEVIDRPASVVKELMENSVDAGATRIDLAVEQGGRTLMRVSDDGEGITRDDLSLAVAPHATSKLDTAEQIAAIETLGFRGEALASIASVSRMRITSRATRDAALSEEGWLMEAAGEAVTDPVPAAASAGTIIEIRDLFFNTPARRRFLRAVSTEAAHIHDTVVREAMVWHDIGITLTHNNRRVVDVPTGQSRRQRSVALLGRELDEALLEYEHEEGGWRLWGLAALPSVTRGNPRGFYLTVNGRVIRDRSLTHAVRESYRGLMPADRYPVCVLHLETDPSNVDVNVHPTKAEVRWVDSRRIHTMVLTQLRQRLLEADLTPTVMVEPPSVPPVHVTEGASGGPPHGSVDRGSQAAEGSSAWSWTSPAAPQRGFDFSEARRALDEVGAEVASPGTTPTALVPATPGTILQVHNSYLVTEDEEGLLIVDQHALHERVVFEQLRQRVLSCDLESQRLLMPSVLKVTGGQMAEVQRLEPLFKKIGIDAEAIGPTQVAVHGFPSFLFTRGVEPKAFVLDLLDQAEAGTLEAGDDGETSEEAALHRVLDMMACKAAVKAGDRMTQAELVDLMTQREQVERSSACPHGRPTTVRLTLKDLAKYFKRT